MGDIVHSCHSRKEKLAAVGLAAGAAAGLMLAASGNARLVQLRGRYHLDAADPLLNAPPAVAFTTVVLGGFRGLIADMLWLRAARMQEEGRFFELVQLADWITKLEPRTTETWGFHAWNMAYNVSIMMADDAERWRWVVNGIRLLARDGLRYNPGDPRLYFELGWIFQHKIGGFTDRRHSYYKRRWADEMTDLIGGGHPDFEALASNEVARNRMLYDYGLSPSTMGEVDRAHGPLDWRTPEAHAVYWAYRGLRAAPDGRFFPCERMIYQSLAVSFARGKLSRDERTGELVAHPNVEILPKAIAAYESVLEQYPMESIRESYAAFLMNALLLLDSSGREQDARRVFELLRPMLPSPDTSGGYEAFLRQRRRAL